ncbi:AraC family transcriptional regulator [Photobacterium sp. ZSDE20]|uniref:AraC family transcriptional regulator n=1 Tax=Photobacterium pectinilyticum TaxID=2906793 RepID=A0ABT1N571_9GAMM|nr:AraC family transcriptional regulator [Photobacterium sp. ZSDE20]MCQ1059895.1 AraC family transcriptional regulator [Photobacterium sp. ZSDE20]MDD1826084.1 AraC family transcriptional regulator [Photobacterium sp. ZSDE20]
MNTALNKLTEFMKDNNDEERSILDNQNSIDMSIFKDANKTTISFDKVVPKGKMISIRKHTRYIHYPAHTHDYVEICYVLEGNSVQYIEGKKCQIRKGDILFMGPGAMHEILPSTKEDIILNFIIHKKYFSYIFEFIDDKNSLSSFFIDAIFKNSTSKALIFTTFNKKPIESLLDSIVNELTIKGSFMESKIKFLLGLLVIELIQESPYVIDKKSHESKVLSQVIGHIERDLQKASLNSIAEQLKMKNYNLSKLIKKESGKTFNTLLRDIRFNKFCELIKVTNVSINEIAIEVGFSNTSDFYRKFRQKYGLSPREYRNSACSELI